MKLCVVLLEKALTVVDVKPLTLRECDIDYGVDLSFKEVEEFQEKHNPRGDIIIRVVDDCADGLYLIEGRVHEEPCGF